MSKTILLILLLLLLSNCNYKTNPLVQDTYSDCVESSMCGKAGLACWMNYGIAQQTFWADTRVPPICFIQTQLCKKRCLDCAAHLGGTYNTRHCSFSEYKLFFTDDSDGML